MKKLLSLFALVMTFLTGCFQSTKTVSEPCVNEASPAVKPLAEKKVAAKKKAAVKKPKAVAAVKKKPAAKKPKAVASQTKKRPKKALAH